MFDLFVRRLADSREFTLAVLVPASIVIASSLTAEPIRTRGGRGWASISILSLSGAVAGEPGSLPWA